MTKQPHPISLPRSLSWLDGPLPSPPSPRPPSGWTGLEQVLPALVNLFCQSDRDSALEFGCEYGYSTSVLAQLFSHVTTVDWFLGDEHSGQREDYSAIARANLAHHRNVEVVQSSYQDWLARPSASDPALRYSLVHIDVVHTYEATYELGRWATDHAKVVLFHDTHFIWPEVPKAVLRVAEETGREFYNFTQHNGLGILF